MLVALAAQAVKYGSVQQTGAPTFGKRLQVRCPKLADLMRRLAILNHLEGLGMPKQLIEARKVAVRSMVFGQVASHRKTGVHAPVNPRIDQVNADSFAQFAFKYGMRWV